MYFWVYDTVNVTCIIVMPQKQGKANRTTYEKCFYISVAVSQYN